MRFSTEADVSGWLGRLGAFSFLDLADLDDFLGLAPEESEGSCCSKIAERFSMSSGERNGDEVLEFELDLRVEGIITGRGG